MHLFNQGEYPVVSSIGKRSVQIALD